jgi:hypothetical protein
MAVPAIPTPGTHSMDSARPEPPRVGLFAGATLRMLMPPPVPVATMRWHQGRSMDGMDGIERAFVSLAAASFGGVAALVIMSP